MLITTVTLACMHIKVTIREHNLPTYRDEKEHILRLVVFYSFLLFNKDENSCRCEILEIAHLVNLYKIYSVSMLTE